MNASQVDTEYRYWRIRTFYSMFFGYVMYYFTRKSFVFAMPAMIQDLNMSKEQLGMVASALSISYAVSKFSSGILADRTNPRFFMGLGLLLTGVVNICFGLSSSLLCFVAFWFLNGLFQGCGAPPCARLMVYWYSQSERGRWWAAWNTAHNVGGYLIALLVAVCCQYWGWRYGLYVPGILCVVGGFWLMERLRDTPESLGLPPVEQWRQDHPEEAQAPGQAALSPREVLFQCVLSNPYIWLLAISFFFLYVIRTAVNDWTMLYFVEAKGYSQGGAGFCVSWFEAGGFLGSLAAGFLSDRVFDGRRGPVNVLFLLGTLLSILGIWQGPEHLGTSWDAGMMFLVGFFVFGPQLLIGMAAAELAQKRAAATATGFAGFFGYVGSAMAGLPFGVLISRLGWTGFFLGLMLCSILPALLLLPTWGLSHRPRRVTPATQPKLA